MLDETTIRDRILLLNKMFHILKIHFLGLLKLQRGMKPTYNVLQEMLT